jgi:hypothetical protein
MEPADTQPAPRAQPRPQPAAAVQVRRPTLLCPACMVTTRDLSLERCPECDARLVARIPSEGRPTVAIAKLRRHPRPRAA